MKRVDDKYGPLEWLLPESHAIYWAMKGLEMSKDQQLRKDDFIGLRRVIFQSLQLAFDRGRLIYPDKSGNEFLYGPNLNVIDEANKAYLEMADLEPDKRDNILNAHKNFVGMAVFQLYTHNRKSAAQQWFQYLKQQYPNATTVGGQPVDNLDDYALGRVAELVGETDPNKVKGIIMGVLEKAFLDYSLGDEESDTVAVNHELFAQRLWTRYDNEIGKYARNEVRVGLPSLRQLHDEVLKVVLNPDYGLDPLLAAQLRTRKNLPPDFGLSSTNAPGTNGIPVAPQTPPVNAPAAPQTPPSNPQR
jgi:hypothetical protein